MRVKMPKDLDNIQAKQIGPFTWRQLIGLGVGGATIYCIWAGLKNFISGDVCLILCIIAAIPFLAIGFLPKSIMQNLYAEQFAAMIIKYNILRPPVRKYKTVNTYDTRNFLAKKSGNARNSTNPSRVFVDDKRSSASMTSPLIDVPPRGRGWATAK